MRSWTVIVGLFVFSCKAQTLPLNTYLENLPLNSYLKDLNNELNFNYELQLGLGVGKILKSDYQLQVVPNLSFRIGYDF